MLAALFGAASARAADEGVIAVADDLSIVQIDEQPAPKDKELHLAAGRHVFVFVSPRDGSPVRLAWELRAGACYGLQNHGPEIDLPHSFTPQVRERTCPELAKDDLAAGRPGFASSKQAANHDAQAALDGNPRTRWSSKFADDQWLYVDLGSVQPVGTVVLRWESAFAKEYHIDLSDDAKTWTPVVEIKDGRGDNDTLDLPENSRGRYVRLSAVKRGTPWGISLWEMEVYAAHWTAARGDAADARGHRPFDAEAAEADGDLPYHWARLYEKMSAEAWEAAKAVLVQLQLEPEARDDQAQAFRSKLMLVPKKWSLPDVGTRIDKVQLQVFVSPYVEPAHVHVRVLVLTDTRRTMQYEALGNWVFALLEAQLGQKGRPMPAGWAKRSRLAREMRSAGADSTCPAEITGDITQWAKPVEQFQGRLYYPQGAIARGANDRVDIEAVLLEDGATIPRDAHSSRTTYADQFIAAAVQWAVFRIYEPTRVGSCAVPIVGMLTTSWRTDNSSFVPKPLDTSRYPRR